MSKGKWQKPTKTRTITTPDGTKKTIPVDPAATGSNQPIAGKVPPVGKGVAGDAGIGGKPEPTGPDFGKLDQPRQENPFGFGIGKAIDSVCPTDSTGPKIEPDSKDPVAPVGNSLVIDDSKLAEIMGTACSGIQRLSGFALDKSTEGLYSLRPMTKQEEAGIGEAGRALLLGSVPSDKVKEYGPWAFLFVYLSVIAGTLQENKKGDK